MSAIGKLWSPSQLGEGHFSRKGAAATSKGKNEPVDWSITLGLILLWLLRNSGCLTNRNNFPGKMAAILQHCFLESALK